MDETLITTNKAEARDAETILTDENATVDELLYVSGGESVGDQVETTTTGASFEDVFGASAATVGAGLGVAAIMSLVFALVVFFAITMKKKASRSKFMRYLREFLNFRKIWIASILKFVYVFLALFITIGSIVMMFFGGNHVVATIIVCSLVLVFGNILLRIGFEMTMITIGLWENTRDIRGVLVKGEEFSEPVKEEIVEEEDEEDVVEE